MALTAPPAVTVRVHMGVRPPMAPPKVAVVFPPPLIVSVFAPLMVEVKFTVCVVPDTLIVVPAPGPPSTTGPVKVAPEFDSNVIVPPFKLMAVLAVTANVCMGMPPMMPPKVAVPEPAPVLTVRVLEPSMVEVKLTVLVPAVVMVVPAPAPPSRTGPVKVAL